jgi:hypothetical protein
VAVSLVARIPRGSPSLLVVTLVRRPDARARKRSRASEQGLAAHVLTSLPFGDQNSPVNSRDKRPNPRIATLHCAIVKAPDSQETKS